MPGPSFYQNFNVKFIRSETELQKEFNLILIIPFGVYHHLKGPITFNFFV